MEVQWIPRSENEKADFISRLIDLDDWQLTESFFATLEGFWGLLIARALHYLKVQRALATLVIPFWPSSSFWPLITCIYAAAVQGYVLEDGCRALMHGRNTNSLLGSNSFRGQVAGIRFDFRSREEGRLDMSKVK